MLDGPAEVGGCWHSVACPISRIARRPARLPGFIIDIGFDINPLGVGPFGDACVQRFDHTSVRSDQVDPAVPVATTPQLFAMFAAIVQSAQRHRVRLASFTTINPRLGIAELG